LVCDTYSLLCIGLITGPAKNYHIYAALIQDIKDMIHLNNVTNVHTLREGDQCANFLFKMGASSDPDLSIHLSVPVEMNDLLRNDAWGTFFPRG